VRSEGRYTLDAQDRLIGDAEKPMVACPKQTDRTAVLLVLGQSNAANYGGQRFASKHGDKIVNFFDGQCYVAASPLLGSSGTKGEYWTQLGNHLIESGKFDTVVIAPMAYSGSAVKRWARGGHGAAISTRSWWTRSARSRRTATPSHMSFGIRVRSTTS